MNEWRAVCKTCREVIAVGAYGRVATMLTIHLSASWPDQHSVAMWEVKP